MDEPQQPDFVVIDRNALRQTLDAVLDTLKSTISFDLLKKNQALNPEQQAELHQQLVNSRGALMRGIKQMLETVETLPSVQINEDSGNDQA